MGDRRILKYFFAYFLGTFFTYKFFVIFYKLQIFCYSHYFCEHLYLITNLFNHSYFQSQKSGYKICTRSFKYYDILSIFLTFHWIFKA